MNDRKGHPLATDTTSCARAIARGDPARGRVEITAGDTHDRGDCVWPLRSGGDGPFGGAGNRGVSFRERVVPPPEPVERRGGETLKHWGRPERPLSPEGSSYRRQRAFVVSEVPERNGAHEARRHLVRGPYDVGVCVAESSAGQSDRFVESSVEHGEQRSCFVDSPFKTRVCRTGRPRDPRQEFVSLGWPTSIGAQHGKFGNGINCLAVRVRVAPFDLVDG